MFWSTQVIQSLVADNLTICPVQYLITNDHFPSPIFDNLTICPVQEMIQRWGVPENITTGLVGEPGDGTTIDLDEPFLLR